MPRKSRLTAVVAAVGIALSLAPLAAADKPSKEPIPFGEFTGQYCEDFAVHIAPTTDGESIKVFSDGSAMITGPLKVNLTNVETGKTINVNIPGPARFSSDGSTLTGTGRWLFFGEAGFLGRPGPTLEESAGHFMIDLGTVTFTSRTGTSRELCSALA